MKRLSLTLAMFFAMMLPVVSYAQIYEPVKWSFSSESLGNNEYNVIFKAEIEAGWHVYSQNIPDGGPIPTAFYFNDTTVYERIGDVVESEAIVHQDPVFEMELRFFEKEATFTQKVKVLGKTPVVFKGELEYMVCNEGQCLPPTVEEFEITLDNQPAKAATSNASRKSLWASLIAAFLWGLAAIVTPCVFPMIPMTVSFFLHGSENKAQGRFKALMYFLFIVGLYTIPIAVIIFITWLGGGDEGIVNIFNWLSTHWIPNIIFFIVFMVFAASFFGAFEIIMPSSLVNKSDEKSNGSGLGGVFFMALTLVLVSFACTGPIVGSVLIESVSGNFWSPILTMLVYSVTFALPFALFALFPSMLKRLPKSGGWLNSVKVVFGFVEVALGFKFLSIIDQTYHWGILDREVYLAIWIVCAVMLGFYLLGQIRFKNDDEVTKISGFRLFLAIVSFAFAFYLIPGMWGAPLKSLSGYLPPIQTVDFDLQRMDRENSEAVINYMEGLEQNTFVQDTAQAATEQPFMTRTMALYILIAIGSLLGLFLVGKIKLKKGPDWSFISLGRLIISIIVFSFVVYLIPGLWGAPLKAMSWMLPDANTMEFNLEQSGRTNYGNVAATYEELAKQGALAQNETADVQALCEEPLYADFLHLPHGINGYFDYQQALACSKAQNKPIFVDFTGHGCVNCREMESSVWADKEVLKILKHDYVVVALYVDDKKTLPEEYWVTGANGKVKKTLGAINADFQVSKFEANAQPYYCLMGNNGELLVDPRSYNLDVEAFRQFLLKGIENFKNGEFVRNINE